MNFLSVLSRLFLDLRICISYSVYHKEMLLSILNYDTQQASTIIFLLIKIIFILFDEVNCKSGGGHYSSQRSLASGLSGGYSGSASQGHWGNPWSDMSAWYDYGKFLLLLIKICLCLRTY